MRAEQLYRVRSDRVLHPDGSSSLVIAAGDLDIDALDPARRAASIAAFTRLCHALTMPLQLVVRVRRAQPPAARTSVESAHSPLEDAMRRHWGARLRERAVFTRTILLATRAAAVSALDESAARLCEALAAVGVSAHRLRDGELYGAVSSGLAFDRAGPVSEHAQHVRIGPIVVGSLLLRRFPGHAVRPGWLAPIVMVPVECDVAIHLRPAALGEALHRLGRRMRDYSAHRLLEADRGLVHDVHIDVAMDSALALRGRLARSLGRPLHCSVSVAVRTTTLPGLRRDLDTAAAALAASLVTVEPAHFRQASALLTALPLGVDALAAAKLVESGAAATCMPWVHVPCADPGGYRIGAALRSGLPVSVAPFETTLHRNANIAVFATSGHGKSFVLGSIVLEAAARGTDSVIIDPEGEYRDVVAALHGSYLSLAPGSDASINIFDVAGAGPAAADDAVAAAVAMIGVMCGDRLDDVERAHVEAAARDGMRIAALARRSALLGDCLEYLAAHAPRIATVVRRYCSDALGNLFNRASTVRIGAGVCAISMRDMPDEHVAVATLAISQQLWQMVRRDPRRRHIVFDEVGALCVHPSMRALLVQLARRCRKYDASLVVATQNAHDVLGSAEGTVIATNCATVLLGGHRPAETALMERAFGLTEAQRGFLETASRAEFLLLAGDRRLPIRVEMPPEHEAILSRREGSLPP